MTTARYHNALLDPEDTLMLFIDHQSGLIQTVKDIDVQELRTNTAALAKVVSMMKIPVIMTASVPEGPNGPLIPEIAQNAPKADFIARKGEVNAWDNEDFVQAVHDSGKKTLVIAGIWTSVCVAFPALSAIAEGYRVFAVPDASGDMSPMSSCITLTRLAQAGVIPVSTIAVVADLQKTWNRPDSQEFAEIYGDVAPNYRALVESFQKSRGRARRTRKSRK